MGWGAAQWPPHTHVNTVDYRLKRMGRRTGIDPSEPNRQWYCDPPSSARGHQQPHARSTA
ncbi:helix-turn-helix domain-containing protein [Nocardia sp. NBC_01730]|nr:helix-turn-helix domain-containing protein [Nocardia sp. NBC_01730]